MESLLITIYTFAVTLLYLPPIFLFALQKVWNMYTYAITNVHIILISVLCYAVMINAAIWAFYPFTFYFILFNLFYFFSERMILHKVKALSLSVYVCYAVSVLWEFPIQLSTFQYIDAVMMSGFRALAIPFFYVTVYKLGWRINSYHFIMISVFLGLGLALAGMIISVGVEPIYYVLHLYRLPWVFLFFSVVLVVGSKSISITRHNIDKL